MTDKKQALIKFVGIKKPELKQKSLEDIVTIVSRLYAFEIPVSYLNNSRWCLEEIEYISALQNIALQNETILVNRLNKSEFETLEHLAGTRDQYRNLAKAILKKNCELSKHEYFSLSSYTSKELKDRFKTLDEALEVLAIDTCWIKEEQKNPGQFPSILKQMINTLGPEENIVQLAQTVYETSTLLRNENIMTDDFFNGFEYLVPSINNVEQLDKTAKKLIELMVEEDIKDGDKKKRRFHLPYHYMFETLGELNHLIKNPKQTETVFKILTRNGREIMGSGPKNWHSRMYLLNKFTDICATIKRAGYALETVHGLEEFIRIARRLGTDEKPSSISNHLKNLNCLFPDKNEENKLKDEDMVLTYIRMIEDTAVKKTFMPEFFMYAIRKYTGLANNSQELKQLTDIMTRIRNRLTKSYGDYETGRIFSDMFPTFRKFINSMPEFEEHSKDLYLTTRYSRRFSGSNFEYAQIVKPIVKISRSFQDFKKNLHSIRCLIRKTDDIYDAHDFFKKILPCIEAESAIDLKKAIRKVQNYLNKWSSEGINTNNIISDGLVSSTSLLEENSLEDVLELLDHSAAKAKEKEVIDETFDILHDLTDYSGDESRITDCKKYNQTFDKLIEIAKVMKEKDLATRDLRIDKHSGNIEPRTVWDNMDEYRDILLAGFVPVDEFMKIYNNIPEKRRQAFLEDVKSIQEDIRQNKRFRLKDPVHRFVMYNIALSSGTIYRSFSIFSMVCEYTAHGIKKSMSYNYDRKEEFAIVNKYGVKD